MNPETVKLLTVATVVIAVVLGIIAFFIPLPPLVAEDSSMHVTLGMSVAFTIMHILAVILFLSGLRSFKSRMRMPYGLLCIGLILLAIAQLQIPIATLSGALWWLRSGGIAVAYLIPYLFIFAGIRSFARLLGNNGILTKFKFVIPLAIGLSATSFLLPVTLSSTIPTETAFHVFLSITLWQLVLTVVSSILMWQITSTIGVSYKDAMRWLLIALVVYVVIDIHFIVLQYIGYDNPYGKSGAYLATLALVSVMFATAGYKFWRIGAPDIEPQNATTINIVIYTAGLVTNPNSIQDILDDVRSVTANSVTSSLNQADRQKLYDVYIKLEDYLVNKEPLRRFSREKLREQIAQTFPDAKQQNPSFWQAINQS